VIIDQEAIVTRVLPVGEGKQQRGGLTRNFLTAFWELIVTWVSLPVGNNRGVFLEVQGEGLQEIIQEQYLPLRAGLQQIFYFMPTPDTRQTPPLPEQSRLDNLHSSGNICNNGLCAQQAEAHPSTASCRTSI